MTLARTWSSVIWTWPTATPKQRTFFNWNLIVERTSVSLLVKSSACETGVGNFPAESDFSKCSIRTRKIRANPPLERPGPSRRGICLMRASDARKASCFLASFFTSFLFLFNLHPKNSVACKQSESALAVLLQIVDRHVLQIDLFGTIDICGICENADGHTRTGDIGQPIRDMRLVRRFSTK